MSEPLVVIHDTLTGETIERPMTPDELAQRDADAAASLTASQEAEAEAEARAEARAAAVSRFRSLGFTDDEISALVLP